MGGMTKAVATGMPKLRIEEAAATRQALIAKGEVDAGRAQLVRATVIDDSRAVAWGALAEAVEDLAGLHGT